MKSERSALAGRPGAGQPERFAVSDRNELLCWSKGLNSRRRGQRSRIIALACGRALTTATALSGIAAGTAVLPASLSRALAATLDNPPRGSLRDIEHIVILMQENRSFDHYFGTMPGVRGFADPAAIRLADGGPVFRQPYPGHAQGYLTPFHLDTKATSAQATPGTDHSWPTQHLAWNDGKMDQWVRAKGPFTMGYFTQADIPFQWALAQAFTVCDRYHCSVLGPTNPNRLYMWTGMIDPHGVAGGPVTDNTPAYNNVTLSWTTYPERLQRAGVSWQVYQEEDNYDDNALAWFKQIAGARPDSDLWQRGMRKRPAGAFEADARAGRLPQVSWLAAQSEHPDYFPAAGPAVVVSPWSAGYPRSAPAITLAAAEAGLLTAQREVFANPAPVVPARHEPVPPAGAA